MLGSNWCMCLSLVCVGAICVRYVHAKDYYYYLESKYTCLHPERAKLGILCTRTDNPLS